MEINRNESEEIVARKQGFTVKFAGKSVIIFDFVYQKIVILNSNR